MCLILFSFDPDASQPLLLAANRDEFLTRPTAAAHHWKDNANVFAGRDLVANGTWLGMTKTGRFAAITNVREPSVIIDNPLSRGDLPHDFLMGDMSAEDYLEHIDNKQHRYCGFNLLVGEFTQSQQTLWYCSNRDNQSNRDKQDKKYRRLEKGVYGLSNHLLDTEWPKVSAGKNFIQQVKQNGTFLQLKNQEKHDALRVYLENKQLAEDKQLPKTGVSYSREKSLSAAFIILPDYGTRTSTVISIDNTQTSNLISFSEKNYQLNYSELSPKDQGYIFKEWALSK
jgi:uncharacterized protein with NRDE domain